MTVYADTSVFVSLYLQDSHSNGAHQRLATHPRIWLTSFHRAEWTHAVGQQVFQGQITAGAAKSLYEDLESDRVAGIWMEVDLPDEVFDRCISLARKHTASLGTRTLDTLHVASALQLRADKFWTFDQRQSKLAEAEGLKLF